MEVFSVVFTGEAETGRTPVLASWPSQSSQWAPGPSERPCVRKHSSQLPRNNTQRWPLASMWSHAHSSTLVYLCTQECIPPAMCIFTHTKTRCFLLYSKKGQFMKNDMTSLCPFKIEWSLELAMLSDHEFAHAGAGQGASGCKRCQCEAG